LFSGAIFTEDQKDSSAELAFKYAVYRINKDKHILPRTTLMYDIQYVPRDDSFHASKKGRTHHSELTLCWLEISQC
jgi:ionotropic kainate glutamate receptor 2